MRDSNKYFLVSAWKPVVSTNMLPQGSCKKFCQLMEFHSSVPLTSLYPATQRCNIVSHWTIISPSVCQSYIRLSIHFSFLDDNLSKGQWTFLKLDMWIDIVEIWFGIANRQNLSHYENKPIQIYWKFYKQKKENFPIKKSDIFHISSLNTDCGYPLEPPRRGGSNEYPQSMFFNKIRKIMHTPLLYKSGV